MAIDSRTSTSLPNGSRAPAQTPKIFHPLRVHMLRETPRVPIDTQVRGPIRVVPSPQRNSLHIVTKPCPIFEWRVTRAVIHPPHLSITAKAKENVESSCIQHVEKQTRCLAILSSPNAWSRVSILDLIEDGHGDRPALSMQSQPPRAFALKIKSSKAGPSN